MVAASGAIHGASRFPVLKQTRLKTLLEYIAVEPELADIKSIYIRRRSVAAEQKVILTDALRRLEQSALTATSASVDEAGIRVKEAELIQNFVQRASKLEPDGVLVVSRGGRISDVLLEEATRSSSPEKRTWSTSPAKCSSPRRNLGKGPLPETATSAARAASPIARIRTIS